MANKSVRLLSLVLSVLMLATMIPVVANADYDHTAVEAPADYEIIDYNSLVGEQNQKIATDVYVVDSDWEFEKGKEPKKVTFTFRNKEVTENYDSTRHFADANSAITQAKADGITMPKIILTAGNYSEQIGLSSSVYLLGARAGMNPNVPSADPSAKWDLSSDRSLAEYASEDSKGETRFWMPGAVDVNAGYGAGGEAYNDFLIQNNTTGSAKYVFDGLYLQGYGAVVRDTAGGSGDRTYIAQNCIFENGYSYDVSTFRLWNRAVNSKRELYVSNSYATGYKQLGFYSGHAAVVEFNGMCWQDNYAGMCYDVEHINMLGLKFTLKNSHFWNSEAVASAATLSGRFHYDRIFYSDYNQGANNANYYGTNTEAYRYNITNNTFWNMERVSGGSYVTSYNLFEIPMGGENEQIVFSDNIFGNTMATGKRHPLQVRYLTVNGVPSHTAEVPSLSDSTTMYALTNDRLKVSGNTFIGKAYTNLTPDIGTNNAEGTLVEMSGNFYTTTLGSTTGTYVEGKFGDKIYDKWVWTDKSEEGMQDPKNRTDYINEEAFSLGGLSTPTQDPEDPYHFIFDVGTKTSVMVWGNADTSAAVNNVVKFYTADKDYNKISELTSSTLSAPERKNYYVAALLSRDRRTSVDYKITVVRNVYAGAELAGIKEDAYPDIKFLSSDETGPDLYSYVVSYDDNVFDFALDVADDATTQVYAYNARGVRYLMENNGTANHYTYELKETEKVYPFEITVTSAAGKSETYAMEVVRGLNTEAELVDVTSDGNTVEKDADAKTYTVTTPIGTKNVEFSIEVSKNATATVTDDLRNVTLTPANGIYSTRISLGAQTYTVEVVSQDQKNTEYWTIEIVRPASTAKEVLNIENATKNGANWEANVEKETFIVNATVSDLASYALYADSACNDRIGNSAITLLNNTTNVYLLVTAEDGTTAVVTLIIVTTKVATEQVPGEPGMSGNGVIAVAGATSFNANTIYVDLGPNAKSYDFRVLGLNGYSVKVWGDANCTLWAPLEMTIVPDTAVTLLYVTATKGSDVKEYVVEIDTTMPVKFSDTVVTWAKKYVDALVESECGIIKGDEHDALNGAKNLTRYEMAVMMVRMLGVNKDLYAGVELPFMDTVYPWAENYIKAAYRAELVGGSPVTDADGAVIGYEFKGENFATRAEFFKVFVNAIFGEDITEYYTKNQKTIDKFVTNKKFADVDQVPEWAKPYVYTTIYVGVVKGDGSSINPNGNITRYEAITMLCRQFFGME